MYLLLLHSLRTEIHVNNQFISCGDVFALRKEQQIVPHCTNSSMNFTIYNPSWHLAFKCAIRGKRLTNFPLKDNFFNFLICIASLHMKS